VGSIKTVVGHLEGAAGLAGLLKGSSSIQKGLIPPNLLFNHLNPRVEPYYQGLHVPTSLTTWPKLPEGAPRRVIVNSFGTCFDLDLRNALGELVAISVACLTSDASYLHLTSPLFTHYFT